MLASSGQRPGMLLNIHYVQDSPHSKELSDGPKMSTVPRLKNPAVFPHSLNPVSHILR